MCEDLTIEIFGIFVSLWYFIATALALIVIGFYFLENSIENNRKPSPDKWTSIIDPKEEAKVAKLKGNERGG